MVTGLLRKLGRAGRRSELTWRYSNNLAPTVAYRFKRTPLSGESARVMTDLDRDGVAVTTVDKLMGTDSCCAELKVFSRKGGD